MSQVRPEAARKKSRARVRILIWIAVAALLLIVIGQIILMRRGGQAPDPAKMDRKDAVKYLASKDFASLPVKEQKSYLDRMRSKSGGPPPWAGDSTLSREEQEAIRRNTGRLMRDQMRERMKTFFAMSQEEKNKFLDQMIREREERMKQDQASGRSPGGPGGSGGPGGNGGPSAGMMQGMLENTDSNSRAQMHEFMTQLRAREQQTKQSGK